MAAFSITSAQPAATLPVTRRARLDFTVTNTSRRDLTARAHVVPDGRAQSGWFTIVGPQRDSPPDATHQFGVQVAVPITADAGRYRFRLDVVGVEDPDEFEGEGEWATIDVPPAPEPRRIPLWAIAIAAVLLVAIVVGVYLKFIRQPPKANLEVSASQQAFGAVPVGQGSPGLVVTIKNSGGADARVSATMAGTEAADFKVLATTCADQPLAAGANCQLQIGFQPTAQGSRAATLTVKAPNAGPPVLMTFSGAGQGTAAAVVFTPASVVLTAPANPPKSGEVPVATVVTVKNNGGTPFTIATVKLVESDLTLNPLFQLVSACDKVTLSGGQTCQVVVLLSTSATPGANYKAQLLVVDDAPGSPQTVPVAGSRAAR